MKDPLRLQKAKAYLLKLVSDGFYSHSVFEELDDDELVVLAEHTKEREQLRKAN